MGLWVSNPKFKYKRRGEKETRKNDEKRAYSVSTSRPIYQTLRHQHGLAYKKRKKPMESVSESDYDSYDDESE